MGEYAVLECSVIRLAEWSPQWEVAEETTRRRRVQHLLADRTHGNRRQTGSLKHVSKRTHGTRAERSDRGEQHDIDPLLAQERRTCRPAVHADLGQVPLVACVGQMLIGNLPNPAAGSIVCALLTCLSSLLRKVVRQDRPTSLDNTILHHLFDLCVGPAGVLEDVHCMVTWRRSRVQVTDCGLMRSKPGR